LLTSNCFLLTSTKIVENKPKPISEKKGSRLKAYWIGHATVLLRMDEKWILTDPIWNDKLANWLGRQVEPGININDIPPIDFILISHAHLDHMDTYTLKLLSKQTHLILPAGAPDFKNYGYKNLSYLKNYDIEETDGLKITAVPAQHFGGRWLIDNFWDGEPYLSYVIQYQGMTVYFAGDTGYNENYFKTIGKMFTIDLALIPFGPFRGWGGEYGNYVHVNPKGAIKTFKDVNAKWMIPIHHGTFYTAPEIEFPYIAKAINESNVKEKIFLLKQGESAEIFPIK
jgi:L-ascorbate metabolism protein UlaG (beta-lactamase superfamily)